MCVVYVIKGLLKAVVKLGVMKVFRLERIDDLTGIVLIMQDEGDLDKLIYKDLHPHVDLANTHVYIYNH